MFKRNKNSKIRIKNLKIGHNRIKGNYSNKPKKFSPKYRCLGVRSIYSGSIHYNRVYTLTRIPRNKN